LSAPRRHRDVRRSAERPYRVGVVPTDVDAAGAAATVVASIRASRLVQHAGASRAGDTRSFHGMWLCRDGGCAATGICIPFHDVGSCALLPACTCAGTTAPAPWCGFDSTHGVDAHEPIAHDGLCSDADGAATDSKLSACSMRVRRVCDAWMLRCRMMAEIPSTARLCRHHLHALRGASVAVAWSTQPSRGSGRDRAAGLAPQ
jgi:hypothetical protein